jgi:hypothetical protein
MFPFESTKENSSELNYLEDVPTPTPVTKEPKKRKASVGYCFSFNRGRCKNGSNCPYSHEAPTVVPAIVERQNVDLAEAEAARRARLVADPSCSSGKGTHAEECQCQG